MRIFVSYSRKDAAEAQAITLAVRGSGSAVFIDTETLRPTDEYHTRIRRAISECDIFVFLISPNSVAKRGYALSELQIAKTLWPEPWGRILPVMLQATPLDAIDPYLMSVTILQPIGSTPADVAAEIARISAVSDAMPAGPSLSESDAVASLLTYLEDRPLLNDETGYQSHFPDHPRQSAADIRERTTAALTKIPRTSSLAPALKQLREAARNFQQATEGAMDGHRAGGGILHTFLWAFRHILKPSRCTAMRFIRP